MMRPAQWMESLIFQQTAVVHLPSMSVASVTLLVLTAQAVIYGFMLWQMIKTAKATTKAADAAIRAVTFTERTHPITERAAVLIESVIGTPPYTIGALGVGYLSVNSKVVFILKNFGRTIAHSVKLSGALTGVGNFPVEESPPTIIAPHGTNSWTTKPLRDWIDDELLKGINAGYPILQYKIDVTYADDFKRYIYHCEGQYEPALQRFLITESRESEAAT